MENQENEKLKRLVKDLVETINGVFSESSEIKEALKGIEEEGYRVDMVLASITRIQKREGEEKDRELVYEFNPFDQAFLQSLKIRLESGEKKPPSNN